MTRNSNSISVIIGLFIALVLTTLFWWPAIASALLPTDIVWRNIASQLADWVFALGLIALVIFGERKGFTSFGFKPLSFEIFYQALGLAGFFLIGMVLWTVLVSPWFPDFQIAAGSGVTGELPPGFFFWFAPFSLITASVAEEIIYRGYAMQRLLIYFKSPWPAIILPHTAFALMHIKDGIEAVVMIFILGGLFTWYFLKTRNLTLLILAHFIIDLMAIIGRIAGFN